MSDYFDAGKWGAIVPIFFQTTDAATSTSAVNMAALGGATKITMPTTGSVIGITVSATTSLTAGTATFRAHKAGTSYADSGYPAPVMNTTSCFASATVAPRNLAFTAGDTVGVSYVSTTTMEPLTNDFSAVLWVQLDPN